MDDIEYIKLERKYSLAYDTSLYLPIRKERDRRRHLFMKSATRSKLLWEWHNSLCESFKN